MPDIPERLEEVTASIDEAAAKADRQPEEIRLIAVSKTHPPETLREVYQAGQRAFGESRVQELTSKVTMLPSDIEWHFIGHLQKNKIRKMVHGVSLIHSIDSPELAADLDRVADEEGLFPRVLLQVNVSGEPSKYGFSPESLRENLERLLELKRIEIMGLMTLAPYSDEPEDSRPHFARLRELAQEIEKEFRLPLPELSMGMSGDYRIGIEEGATLVRVGSAIFGPRSKKQ